MRVLFVSLSVIVISALLYKYLKVDLIKISDMEKCPYCYGTDLCELFLDFKINIADDSLHEIIINRFSVKNVFYAKMFLEKIVLKKLAHAHELQKLDETICVNFTKRCDLNLIKDNRNFTNEILNTLTAKRQDVTNFKVCSKTTALVFLQEILLSATEDNLKHIWTILQVNVEPLLLQILDSKWPVPKHLGACGRFTAQTYGGVSLNSLKNAEWFARAYLAYQLLIAAKNFTFDHDKFAFYLTDISPDNIAVDHDLTLTFIDLENVILKLKTEGRKIHRSTHYEEEDALFVYSEDDICSSRISDHNFYAVCSLLLSPNAPWPMMTGGLLHSAPLEIATELFESIDLCVKPTGGVTRFVIAQNILAMLGGFLYAEGFDKIL